MKNLLLELNNFGFKKSLLDLYYPYSYVSEEKVVLIILENDSSFILVIKKEDIYKVTPVLNFHSYSKLLNSIEFNNLPELLNFIDKSIIRVNLKENFKNFFLKKKELNKR